MKIYRSGRGVGTKPTSSMTLSRQIAQDSARQFWQPATQKTAPPPGKWALYQWCKLEHDPAGTVPVNFKGRPKRQD
jgi:hypothetical protein